jgi:hypothetical protein
MMEKYKNLNCHKSSYLRYFDSPFDLRFEDLVQARRRLLDRDGVLYREPLIELPSALATAARTSCPLST